MQVRVLYFGMLREIAGCEKEIVQIGDESRLGDLFAQLRQRFPQLDQFRGGIALAVNYEYSDNRTMLHHNDELALIPPVSGGAVKGEGSTAEFPLPLISEHTRIVREPIKTAQVLAAIKQPEAGVVATFDGIVRGNSRGRQTLYLEYTAYDRMALGQMEQLARQALNRFEIGDVRMVHRLGRLQIGETSVYIAVAAAHRAPAFEACRWLIDALKTTVPIWKKEYFADGAVWADGEAFPADIPLAGSNASK
jgi:MoaE-MoaD fusion protein